MKTLIKSFKQITFKHDCKRKGLGFDENRIVTTLERRCVKWNKCQFKVINQN
jgi:leucyl-tRNA synthetase